MTKTDDPKVDYLYSASGQLIARAEKDGASTKKTKLYFYFSDTTTIAEEVSAAKNTTKMLYFVSATGAPLAKQADPEDPSSKWVWLLQDRGWKRSHRALLFGKGHRAEGL